MKLCCGDLIDDDDDDDDDDVVVNDNVEDGTTVDDDDDDGDDDGEATFAFMYAWIKFFVLFDVKLLSAFLSSFCWFKDDGNDDDIDGATESVAIGIL